MIHIESILLFTIYIYIGARETTIFKDCRISNNLSIQNKKEYVKQKKIFSKKWMHRLFYRQNKPKGKYLLNG